MRIALWSGVLLFLTNYDNFVTRRVLFELTGAPNLAEFRDYTTLHGEFHRLEGGLFPIKESYQYAINNQFYTECNPTSPDTIVYRTFRMRPLQFWN